MLYQEDLLKKKENLLIKMSFCTEGIFSWPRVAWLWWQVTGLKRWKFQTLKYIGISSYTTLLCTIQRSLVLLWWTYTHTIHIPSKNALCSVSHLCPAQNGIAVISNGLNRLGVHLWNAQVICVFHCELFFYQPFMKRDVPGLKRSNIKM